MGGQRLCWWAGSSDSREKLIKWQPAGQKFANIRSKSRAGLYAGACVIVRPGEAKGKQRIRAQQQHWEFRVIACDLPRVFADSQRY